MNKEKGDSLPAEYQEAIEKLSGKEASLGAAEAFANDVVEKRDKITAAGGQFVELEASASLRCRPMPMPLLRHGSRT